MCSDTSNGGSAGTAGTGPTELQEQLIVAEYNQCRSALLKNIELMDRSEVFYLTAAGAAAAYYLAKFRITPGHSATFIETNVAFFPLYILVFGLLRFFALDNVVRIYNNYLKNIEEKHKNYLDFTGFFREKIKKFYFITGWSLTGWHSVSTVVY